MNEIVDRVKEEFNNFKEVMSKDNTVAKVGVVCFAIFVAVCVGLSIISGGLLQNTLLYGAVSVLFFLIGSQLTKVTILGTTSDTNWKWYKMFYIQNWGRDSVPSFWIPFTISFILSIIGFISL